ncbi:MAG TPA: PDZ domain-containing protein [Saprospiraceae bacterium]|nr:PDZ domain-containing protein [Saprospiraceae bacterium]HMQ82499.1 PDZ domain-containing protein [Saprospiraceae bacterium]
MKFLLTLVITASVVVQNQAQHSAFMGIESTEVSVEKAALMKLEPESGRLITRVYPNTAAEKAGIQVFDFVTGIDSLQVNEERSLNSIIKSYTAGEKATVHLIRKGKEQHLSLQFGSREDFYAHQPEEKESGFLGIQPHAEETLDEEGVKVNIISNSTAEALGLKNGDQIAAINGHCMLDWEDISTIMRTTSPGAPIQVTFRRGEQIQTLEGVIKSKTDTYENNYTTAWKAPQDYAFLGIISDPVTKEKAEKLGFDNYYGSYVSRIVRHSAAEKAGIQPFDYIYGIDEYRTGKEQNLSSILKKYSPGDKAAVQLVRKGQKKKIEVTFGKRGDSNDEDSERNKCEEAFFGVSARNVDQAGGDGVAVNIVSNSTAESMGLKHGDALLNINGVRIIDWSDVSTSIDNMKVGETIQVEYSRNGQKLKASQTIKSYCDTHPQENQISEKKDNIWFERYFNQDDRAFKGDYPSQRKVSVTTLTSAEINAFNRSYNAGLQPENTLDVSDLKLVSTTDNDKCSIYFVLNQAGSTGIKIYNHSGRIIYDYDLGNFSGSFRDEVDLAQNDKSFYILEIKQNSKAAARKIVLMNP